MQVRLNCFNCHTPFVIKPDEVDAALNELHEKDFKHYNAHCPKCGKANKVSKKQLQQASPNWKPAKTKK